MDARIESRGPLFLAGMGFYGNPFGNASAWDEDNEIGSLWKRLMGFLRSAPSSGSASSSISPVFMEAASGRAAWYEVHIIGPEMRTNGRYEVFAGIEIAAPEALSALPPALSAKALPGGDYAVLALKGEEISSDWESAAAQEILPGLKREAGGGFSFQRYDDRFKGMERLSESVLEAWIPLLPVGKA